MAQAFVLRTEPYRIPGYPDWLSALLRARGADTQEAARAFLHPALSDLTDPSLLPGANDAARVIRAAALDGARAVVYGDYDVDGLCAATILAQALRRMGMETDIYIPDRHSEGYGVNGDAVTRLASGARLLITVDCGIANREELARARALGMQVIVSDHHTPPEQLPDADAVVHPMLGAYPFPHLCGAGVAWKIACLLHGLDAAAEWLDLAALATIADMVPLTGENRVIAAFGLDALGHTARLGLRALKRVAGMEEDAAVAADRVSFGLSPRLNAGGRLTTAQAALRLLNTQDAQEAYALAGELDRLNVERRQIQETMRAQALAQLRGVNLMQVRSLVLADTGWNKGVAGLVAGRLSEDFGYPAIVLAGEDGAWTGSGRSAGDVDLYAALSACAPLLTRFGGHRQAAGLALGADDLPAFRAAFDRAVRAQAGDGPMLPRVYYDAEVALPQVTLDMVEQLQALAPFGTGNPTPVVLCRNAALRGARAVGGGRHTKMTIAQGDACLDAIYFGMGEPDALPHADADVAFEPAVNCFGGTRTAQAIVRAVRAGDQAFVSDEREETLALLQDYAHVTANNESGVLYPPAATQADCGSPEGVLLFCRTQATAQQMHRAFPGHSVVYGGRYDPRAHSAVVCAHRLGGVDAPYATIILCDGCLCPGEQRLAPEGARVLALPASDALAARLNSMRLPRDTLRQAYVALRHGDHALAGLDVPEAARLAAAYVLRQMGLISFPDGLPRDVQVPPPHPSDPDDCPLYRLLNPDAR